MQHLDIFHHWQIIVEVICSTKWIAWFNVKSMNLNLTMWAYLHFLCITTVCYSHAYNLFPNKIIFGLRERLFEPVKCMADQDIHQPFRFPYFMSNLFLVVNDLSFTFCWMRPCRNFFYFLISKIFFRRHDVSESLSLIVSLLQVVPNYP